MTSILSGAISALVLISISPTILVDVLGHDDAIFPLRNPALFSMPLAFGLGIAVSLLRPERAARESFVEAERQIHLGPAARRIRPRATPARAR